MPFAANFPRTFEAASIARYAPVTAGVFGICNASEWILIAESNNIRESLLQLVRERETNVGRRGPTGFVFEACASSVTRAVCHKRLVGEFRPAFSFSGSLASREHQEWSGK